MSMSTSMSDSYIAVCFLQAVFDSLTYIREREKDTVASQAREVGVTTPSCIIHTRGLYMQ